jgi:tRNA (adenine-N(1)-)-methyltransferase non-catalytic subunit
MEVEPEPLVASAAAVGKRPREEEEEEQLQPPNENTKDCIKEGDTVIYYLHDSSQMGSMLKINPREQQKVGSKKYSVKSLIGAPYGSVFELQQRTLRLVGEYAILGEVPEVASGFTEASSSTGNNSGFSDTNTAQHLRQADITQLKEQGASGHDIIRSLIQNSDTWENKSQFAREKWLARKQKRYVRRVRIVKCTPDILADVYHIKNKDKICNLRAETLAQLLAHGGVHAGAKVMIFESCVGLVIGAAAYRMGGRGEILAPYGGQQPHYELMDRLNLSEEDASIIKPVHSEEIGPASEHMMAMGFPRSGAACVAGEGGAKDGAPAAAPLGASYAASNSRSSLVTYKKSGRADEELSVSRRLLRSGLNGMIIATKFDPLAVIKEALVLLYPSSPFAIFSEFMEPLVECYHYLHGGGLAIRLQVRMCNCYVVLLDVMLCYVVCSIYFTIIS